MSGRGVRFVWIGIFLIGAFLLVSTRPEKSTAEQLISQLGTTIGPQDSYTSIVEDALEIFSSWHPDFPPILVNQHPEENEIAIWIVDGCSLKRQYRRAVCQGVIALPPSSIVFDKSFLDVLIEMSHSEFVRNVNNIAAPLSTQENISIAGYMLESENARFRAKKDVGELIEYYNRIDNEDPKYLLDEAIDVAMNDVFVGDSSGFDARYAVSFVYLESVRRLGENAPSEVSSEEIKRVFAVPLAASLEAIMLHELYHLRNDQLSGFLPSRVRDQDLIELREEESSADQFAIGEIARRHTDTEDLFVFDYTINDGLMKVKAYIAFRNNAQAIRSRAMNFNVQTIGWVPNYRKECVRTNAGFLDLNQIDSFDPVLSPLLSKEEWESINRELRARSRSTHPHHYLRLQTVDTAPLSSTSLVKPPPVLDLISSATRDLTEEEVAIAYSEELDRILDGQNPAQMELILLPKYLEDRGYVDVAPFACPSIGCRLMAHEDGSWFFTLGPIAAPSAIVLYLPAMTINAVPSDWPEMREQISKERRDALIGDYAAFSFEAALKFNDPNGILEESAERTMSLRECGFGSYKAENPEYYYQWGSIDNAYSRYMILFAKGSN